MPGEPLQPIGDIKQTARGLQHVVIGRAPAGDHSGECDQARFAERLRQRLFGQGAANAAVSIFEGMDAHEVEVGYPCLRQRGHLFRALVPGDETVHLGGHAVGRRRLIVHSSVVIGPGNHLHRLGMLAVFADHRQSGALAHQHPVPGPQRCVIHGRSERAAEGHHHLGYAGLGGRDSPPVAAQSELAPDRRLHRGPVEDFAFDRRGVECFVTQPLDPQVGLILVREMAPSAHPPAGLVQESSLQRRQPGPVPDEAGPPGLLPYPGHGR